MAAITSTLDSKPTDEGAYRQWDNLTFIVDNLSGTVQYAQNGVVFFEY
jgi:hypothetical protein